MYIYSLLSPFMFIRDNTSTVESDVNQVAKVPRFSWTISSSSGVGTPKRCSTSRTNDATILHFWDTLGLFTWDKCRNPFVMRWVGSKATLGWQSRDIFTDSNGVITAVTGFSSKSLNLLGTWLDKSNFFIAFLPIKRSIGEDSKIIAFILKYATFFNSSLK